MFLNLFSSPLRFSTAKNSIPPTIKSDFEETDRNAGGSKINISPSFNKFIKKPLNNENLSKKEASRKRLEYQDYDGAVSKNHDIPVSWPHIEIKCQSYDQSARSLVSYDDQMFLNLRSTKQSSNDKVMKKKTYKRNNKKKKPLKTNIKNQKLTNLNVKTHVSDENLVIHEECGYSSSILFDISHCESNNSSLFSNCSAVRRQHEKEEDVKSAKVRKVNRCEDRNKGEKQIVAKKSSKKPLSKNMLKKMEKTRIFKEKMKERQAKEASHAQGVQKRVVPCKYFINGCCKNVDCTFSHDVPQPKKDEPCKFFIMAHCTKGGDCLYRHGEWPCKFFHIKKDCRIEKCKFSHEPLTEISQKWLDKILEEDQIKIEEVKKNEETSSDTDSLGDFYGTSSRSFGAGPSEQSIAVDSIIESSNSCERFSGISIKTTSIDNGMQQSQSTIPHGVYKDNDRRSIVESSKIHGQKILQPENPPYCNNLPRIIVGDNPKNQFHKNELNNNFNLINIDVNIEHHISLFGYFEEAIEIHRKRNANDITRGEFNCNRSKISFCSDQLQSTNVRTAGLFSVPLLFGSKHDSNKSTLDALVAESYANNSLIISEPKKFSSVETRGLFSAPLLFSNKCETNNLESNKMKIISTSDTNTNIFGTSKSEQQKLPTLHIAGLFKSPLLFPSKSEMKCISNEADLCNATAPKDAFQIDSTQQMAKLFSRPLTFSSSKQKQQKCSTNAVESKRISALDNDINNSSKNVNNEMQMTGLFSAPLFFSSKSDMNHDAGELESNKIVKNTNGTPRVQQSFSNDGSTGLFSVPLSFSSRSESKCSSKIRSERIEDISDKVMENSLVSVKSYPQKPSMETSGLFLSPLSFTSKCNSNRPDTLKWSDSSLQNINLEYTRNEPQISSTISTGLFSAPLSFNSKFDVQNNSTKAPPTLKEVSNDLLGSHKIEQQISSTIGLFSNPLSFSSNSDVKCNSYKPESNKIFPMSKRGTYSSKNVQQTSSNMQTAGLFSNNLSFSPKHGTKCNPNRLESDKTTNVSLIKNCNN